MSNQIDPLFAALSAPMAYKWRLKGVTNKAKKPYPEGTKGQFLAYIDARDVFNRLDDVLGPANWQSHVRRVNEDGSVIVALSIRIDGEWIDREDIGYSNNPGEGVESEPLKAAVSDGVKRAAIHYGIGRFLYDTKAVWTPINEYGDPLKPLNNRPPAAKPTRQPAPAAPAAAVETVDPETGEIGPDEADEIAWRERIEAAVGQTNPNDRKAAWIELLAAAGGSEWRWLMLLEWSPNYDVLKTTSLSAQKARISSDAMFETFRLREAELGHVQGAAVGGKP